MSKPNWNNAPKWARYLAMDENNTWFWYERMPCYISDTSSWDCMGMSSLAETGNNRLIARNTLEERT